MRGPRFARQLPSSAEFVGQVAHGFVQRGAPPFQSAIVKRPTLGVRLDLPLNVAVVVVRGDGVESLRKSLQFARHDGTLAPEAVARQRNVARP